MSDAVLGLICVESLVAVDVLLGVLTVDVTELSAVECLMMFLMHGLFDDEVNWLSVMVEIVIVTGIFSCLSNLESMVALRFVT